MNKLVYMRTCKCFLIVGKIVFQQATETSALYVMYMHALEKMIEILMNGEEKSSNDNGTVLDIICITI